MSKDPPSVVPLGALPGFNLGNEVSFVASYYGVSHSELRQGTGRRSKSQRLAHARAALFWRLMNLHKLSTRRVGALLGVDPARVNEGAKRHAARIAEFRATHNIKFKEPLT